MIHKNVIVSGFLWSFGERIVAQFVSLVVGVVLARILLPEDYGVISIVMTFITICDVFVTSGFGTAIVRQQEASILDFNTAFIISLMLSIILYFIIFISAPYISNFYRIDILCSVMRIFGIRILISAINNIQHAYIQRTMQYRKFFIATLFGTIISCIVGIIMAYTGFGVWSLVMQYMTNTIIDTIVLLFVSGWHPRFEFSFLCAKKIYSFGWKMLLSQFICTISSDIRGLIIGKVFGANDLAYYDQGGKYPGVIVNNMGVAIAKVMLPVFARSQNDLVQLKNMLRKSIKIGIFITAPMMCGFAAVSENFVRIVLTDKWMPAVPFIQLMCLAYMTRPLEEFCHRAILALGKSGTSMRIMIIINSFSLSLTLIAVFGIKKVIWVAAFFLVHTVCSLICFMYVSNKYIGYLLKEQIKDMLPSILISICMSIAVILLSFLKIYAPVLLLVQVVSGMLIFCILARLFKFEQYYQLITSIKKARKIGNTGRYT